MIRTAIILALLIHLAPPERCIRVVFVVPPGEQLTNAEQAEAIAAVAGGVAFWHADLPIKSTSVITIAADTSLEWSRPYLHDASADLTLFIIDNSTNGKLLPNGAVGQAQDYYGAIWVVLHGFPGEGGLAATIAHELGHVVYGLDDLPPGLTDIMSMPPTVAYHAGFIGCTSLAAIEAPCHYSYMPLVKL